MEQVVVQDPIVILLSAGATDSQQSSSRGHLFEHFMSTVMSHLGYANPTTENLNVKRDGVELDISLRHDLDQSIAIAECKAYSSHIPVPLITAFYGRLAAQRLAEPDLRGFFFAIPRLTADAAAFVKTTLEGDKAFRCLTAVDIWKLLVDRKLIAPVDAPMVSDHALIVHETGVFCAALQLDPATRVASQVLVRAKSGGVSDQAMDLLREHPFSQGLQVTAITDGPPPTPRVAALPSPVIVEVRGSLSDFEYQLPASPKFFVGRADAVSLLSQHMKEHRGPFVLNAQSGWGKSSLALKVASMTNGASMVFDSRTATGGTFVAAALKRAATVAEAAGVLRLPDDVTWATTAGALRAFERGQWQEDSTLVVVFDQFENVFSDVALTSEFRDVALWNLENHAHVIVGFAWKTDYVDWIENHPYRLRDQIRDSSTLIQLPPFGSREVETILRRLEVQVSAPLTRELRQRLREYSQGLPWLLKKLSGHLIREFARGKTNEQLIGEALNVQDLFDSDLATLSPKEREALTFVARYAPVLASEATELHTAALIQSLINQRLVVQVGEKLDTYWDIFRDYLNTGRVPIEDSYILRLSPNSIARLVSELLGNGGTSSAAAIAQAWETSENVVLNSIRELRQLGLASYSNAQIALIPEVSSAASPEAELRQRVATALRRHRAWTEFTDLSERGQGRVSIPGLAGRLRDAFPAVEGTENTWTQYARTFVSWFEYAGLAKNEGSHWAVAPEGTPGKGSLTTRASSVAVGIFPTRAPGPALAMLREAGAGHVNPEREKRKYFHQLVALGAVTIDPSAASEARVTDGLLVDGEIDQQKLLSLLAAVSGGAAAIEALRANPSIRTQEMGDIFAKAYKTSWTESTKDLVGKNFFAWARAAGVDTRRAARRSRERT